MIFDENDISPINVNINGYGTMPPAGFNPTK